MLRANQDMNVVVVSKQAANQVGTDEPGCAGDQNPAAH